MGKQVSCPKCNKTFNANSWRVKCRNCGTVWDTYEKKIPSCFPAGTLIETPHGVLDIAAVKEGDHVLAFDPRQAALRTRRILKVCKHEQSRIWEIGFTDGSRIRTTAIHSFRVAGTWKQARHVGECDDVCGLDASGQMATRQVASSSPTTNVEEVFNLIVEGEFSFVADGVVAHSFSYFKALRVLWWTVYGALRGWLHGTNREGAEHVLAQQCAQADCFVSASLRQNSRLQRFSYRCS